MGLGIVASGIVGALGGAGSALNDVGIMAQKEEIERMREERLSQLRMQEHAVNTKLNSDVAIAAIPQTMAAQSAAAAANADTDAQTKATITGATELASRKAMVEAGPIPETPEAKAEREMRIQHMQNQDARGEEAAKQGKIQHDLDRALKEKAIDAKYSEAKKQDLPNFGPDKSDPTGVVAIDENKKIKRVAVGSEIPGRPAKEGGWWGVGSQKEVPAQHVTYEYFDMNTGNKLSDAEYRSRYPGLSSAPNEGSTPEVKQKPQDTRAASGKIGGVVSSFYDSNPAGSMAGVSADNPNASGALKANKPGQVARLQTELSDAQDMPTPTPDAERIRAQNIKGITAELARLGVGGQAAPLSSLQSNATKTESFHPNSSSLPSDIPVGSIPLGKASDGKTVYQSPDGKKWTSNAI